MEDNGEIFDVIEFLASMPRIQVEINSQKYSFTYHGETEETGAFVLDPEYPAFHLQSP
jgi:hypothetical protein